jgi:hypothetical protein
VRMLLKCEVMKIGRHESRSLKSVDAAAFVLVVCCVFVYVFCELVGFWYPCIVSHAFPDELFVDFMFEFPCIISLYYIKNQQDATLAVLFISN